MHVPDGFLDAPTSVGTAAVAVVGVAVAMRGSRRELDDRTAPLAGLVAAFVFAAQMVNFPVGAGTSGHLLGGALAVALVGPWTAVLAVSVVLLVQALLFADGGTTALGTNIVLLGLVGPAVAALLRNVVANPATSSAPDFLTDREREILQLVAESHSTKEIAAKLDISVKTVDNHRTNLMRKLNLHDVASLTRYALEVGLIEPKKTV